jgi:hypothetical protein
LTWAVALIRHGVDNRRHDQQAFRVHPYSPLALAPASQVAPFLIAYRPPAFIPSGGDKQRCEPDPVTRKQFAALPGKQDSGK